MLSNSQHEISSLVSFNQKSHLTSLDKEVYPYIYLSFYYIYIFYFQLNRAILFLTRVFHFQKQ